MRERQQVWQQQVQQQRLAAAGPSAQAAAHRRLADLALLPPPAGSSRSDSSCSSGGVSTVISSDDLAATAAISSIAKGGVWPPLTRVSLTSSCHLETLGILLQGCARLTALSLEVAGPGDLAAVVLSHTAPCLTSLRLAGLASLSQVQATALAAGLPALRVLELCGAGMSAPELGSLLAAFGSGGGTLSGGNRGAGADSRASCGGSSPRGGGSGGGCGRPGAVPTTGSSKLLVLAGEGSCPHPTGPRGCCDAVSASMPGLQRLRCDGCPGLNAHVVGSSLATLTQLTRLELQGCPSLGGEEPLLSLTAHLPHLAELDVRHCKGVGPSLAGAWEAAAAARLAREPGCRTPVRAVRCVT